MRRVALLSLLLVLAACDRQAERQRRGADRDPVVTESVDWMQSAGVFIGIETFRAETGAPEAVRYAADDATDLAWLFAKDLPSLLPPDRTLLLLSGWPHKRISQEHLLVLQNDGSLIGEGVDAAKIYGAIAALSAKVGPAGVLILSIATHGYTTAGAHVLLTPDATIADPTGVVLDRMLGAIAPGHGRRVLLFVDACRKPLGPAPARLFEELRFPGDYAIFAASVPGGYARSSDVLQNGFFTSAVIDGLGRWATTDADRYVTPSTLGAYVSGHVRDSTGGEQRPEARFGGLAANLPLFRRGDVRIVGSVVRPGAEATVRPQDRIDVRVVAPGLSMTVVICSATTGRCWKQNAAPVAAPANEVTSVGVQFGDTDTFRVHVALTMDETFLQNETTFARVPLDRRANRVVYWLPPVTVERKESS